MENENVLQREGRQPVNIEEEMRGSYLAYAMSVIIGRALPDVRDGLKPVHRRALYAMYELRNFHNTAYKKSARIVGDVIGKYHPHGDTAVYDTIVRLAQDFSMRYRLVDGQGNFGSVDGDPAAAMRYTEVRMTRLAGDLLADLEKETVDWQENYDGSTHEPTVLPAAFPNLLVNGSGGIAVGMATNMPPHNLIEVIDATVALIRDPDIGISDLMQLVPGPDFPTGGFVYGLHGIREAYETGRGRIHVRAKADIELDEKGDEHAIAVTELPYQVNKARLLERIAELVRDKKIEGIRDLRDESDRRGMRIYIELKRGAIAQIVLNRLFATTAMQTTFGIINLAIVRGQPRVLNLKELLVHFVNHRRDVVTRRCRFELRKAEERAHILEGYLRALEHIDEIVALIKGSATPPIARQALVDTFAFSEVQAQSILDMRLQRLTGLEVDKIRDEFAQIIETIDRLRAILASDELLMDVIVEELVAVRDRYGDRRRTHLVSDSGTLDMEDLIADEDMVVTVTGTGYIKRTPLAEYRTQRRGGRGRSGMNTKSADEVTDLFVASAHTMLLIFTDRGQVYPIKVWELPKGGINASGKAIVNLINIEEGEAVRSILPVENLEDEHLSVVFATRRGIVKRTTLNLYRNVRNAGIRALVLDEDDDLVSVRLAAEGQRIMLATAKGQCIIFELTDVRPMGRPARGVRGIRLRHKDDYVVAMDVVIFELEPSVDEVDDEELAAELAESEAPDVEEDAEGDEADIEDDEAIPSVVFVTRNGYGKRTPLSFFRVQRRGGLGLRGLPWVDRNGDLVSMSKVPHDHDLMVVTDGGTIIRLPVAEIRAYSRQARGVRIIALSEDEQVVSIHAVAPGEDDADGDEDVVEALAGQPLEADGAGDDAGADGAEAGAFDSGDGTAQGDPAGETGAEGDDGEGA